MRLDWLGSILDLTRSIRTPVIDKNFWKSALNYQFIYSIVGLVLGLARVLTSAVLFIHGVTANAKSWTASFRGAKTSMSDVPAGAILFVVGLVVVYITRFVVKSQEKKAQPKAKKK